VTGLAGFDRVEVRTNVGDEFLTDDVVVGAVESQPPASVVPEPGTWALLGTGLLGLAGMARRRGLVAATERRDLSASARTRRGGVAPPQRRSRPPRLRVPRRRMFVVDTALSLPHPPAAVARVVGRLALLPRWCAGLGAPPSGDGIARLYAGQ
jgi:hypothetical protein